MTPTEKHRETAKQVFADADFAETVPEAVEIIAAALAKAEREGMKRAADICKHFAQQWDTGGFGGKSNDGFNACMQSRDAILSECEGHKD